MENQLRILHIVQSMNRGGIETMLMNIYRNIDRKIIQFDFILSCEIKSDYEDEILSLGGNIFRMPPISIITPYKYLRSVNIFFKKHPNYNIVHSHMNAVSVLPLYIAKKNHVSVIISHSHTTRAMGYKSFFKKILKYPLRYIANNYFACSKDAANFLYGKWFFKSANCYLLNNAINTRLYIYNSETRSQIRKQYNIENKIVIGHVGRFSAVKNHTFILDIFKSIHDKNQDTILMLVGDGELRSQMEEKIVKMKLEESVILTGVVQNVYDYLQAMDIYLFPSLYEGISLSIIEAQAADLICFVSDAIDQESKVSDNVEFISLSRNAEYWANTILSGRLNHKRSNKLSIIESAGYDVNTSSQWLQNFYITKTAKIKH